MQAIDYKNMNHGPAIQHLLRSRGLRPIKSSNISIFKTCQDKVRTADQYTQNLNDQEKLMDAWGTFACAIGILFIAKRQLYILPDPSLVIA